LANKQLLASFSQGTSIKGFTTNDIKDLKIAIPTLPEQQKIASFLSAVDEKIQQLTRKATLLEQYKKGVMQQLFSGKLRFKDENGKDYPDWEEKKVQELINEKAIISLLDGNHGALYPKSEEFTSKGVPYIAANNLLNGKVKFSDCKFLPIERAKKFKKGIAKNGDVLFAHNATVGPTALLITELDYVILSTTVTYYRCDVKILSNNYLLHYFNSDNFINQYTRVMSQSTRNQVPITMQKKFSIDFPCLEEQQKIANFLSGIDSKIESVNQQLAQTQTFKKGLLQQMFV
jgi:type I restriction enzyme S subunit